MNNQYNRICNCLNCHTRWLPLIVFLLFMMVNPVIGVLLFALYIIIERKNDSYILPFCSAIILFLACLNAVKIPESDTIWYYEYYRQVPRYDFIKYIFLRGKEPVFGLFNWIIYQFVGKHSSIYGAFITVITYGLLLYSVYKFGKANKYSDSNILLGIIAMAFIPYIFTQSNHGIRQFMANSILAYIMVERIYYGKKKYFLMLVMFFIHSSSGLFIPLLFLRFLKQPFEKKNAIYYICVVVGIFIYRILGEVLLPVLSGNDSLSYVASRMAQDREGGMVMQAYMIVLNIAILLSIIFLLYKNKMYRVRNEKAVPFMHILCILIIYVLSNYNQDVISLRFNFYIWVFFPFIIMFVAHALKIKAVLCYAMALGIYIYSFYYLEKMGTWSYNISMPVYQTPLLYY